MKINPAVVRRGFAEAAAFTLVEVVVSMALAVVVCGAIMKCYTLSSRRAQFSACSLAANAQAMKKLEQAIYANWVPSIGTVQLFNTALTNNDPENLEMPIAQTNVVYCTNFTTITQISTNPALTMIRVDCVWKFMDLGVFTNSIAVIRGPNVP